MIVDLVRNDLSKIATKSSVNVDELCEIYSFPTVHQMISTISCEISTDTAFSAIIKATFPMGSMTGAPKKEQSNLQWNTKHLRVISIQVLLALFILIPILHSTYLSVLFSMT